MKKQVSITVCRHAILITEKGYEPGITLDINGEELLITDVEIRDGRWYANDHLLTRGQQEKLTRRAYAIIKNDWQPRVAPTKSIRDCQKAISTAGGIRISLRGKEWLITEVRTGGAGDSRWFGGGLRFTATEQEMWLEPSSNIAARQRTITAAVPESITINSTFPETKVKTGDGDGRRREEPRYGPGRGSRPSPGAGDYQRESHLRDQHKPGRQ